MTTNVESASSRFVTGPCASSSHTCSQSLFSYPLIPLVQPAARHPSRATSSPRTHKPFPALLSLSIYLIFTICRTM
ncbi:hypothetical protein K439DRAFT_1632604 [Ramaria rubella]|nr:hypothetical protein K439DRAFT_1632604 [Ramaria rubella]